MRWLFRALAAMAVFLAFYVGSAVHALTGLVSAARARDAAALVSLTDGGALRRSVATQVAGALGEQLAAKGKLKPIELGLATAAADSYADAVVGALMSPENLQSVLGQGVFIGKGNIPEISGLPRLTDIDLKNVSALLPRLAITTPVVFKVQLSNAGDPENYGGIRMRFNGLGWKLSGIDVPRAALRRMIGQLVR